MPRDRHKAWLDAQNWCQGTAATTLNDWAVANWAQTTTLSAADYLTIPVYTADSATSMTRVGHYRAPANNPWGAPWEFFSEVNVTYSGSHSPRVPVADSPELRRIQEDDLRRQRGETRDGRMRALRLLHSCLTPDQLLELQTHSFFTVTAPSGRRYRIHQGQVRNIIELDQNGEKVRRWCGHPDPKVAGVPDEDAMLAQKFMLETDEQQFRRVANLVEGNRVDGPVPQPAA